MGWAGVNYKYSVTNTKYGVAWVSDNGCYLYDGNKIINLIKKETRKSFKVIITGGFSNLFKNSIKTKVSHNKNITINGLIKISKLIK